ncbi:MAG: Phosphopantetheine adenylyltransferase [Chlamydiae bacterium]|nr:Phosphopantetheine adenylyltransferase [Chlamydiota bacterium]
MFKAIYSGSFDPPTWGHIRLIRRAAKLFDVLIVGIGENLKKGKGFFTIQEKIDGFQKEIGDLPNVEIMSFSGLVTNFAKENGIDLLVRGLRFVGDMEYEMQMARANYKLTGIETFFLMADEDTSTISSSLIRELAANGAPLGDYIPSHFETLLHNKTQKE